MSNHTVSLADNPDADLAEIVRKVAREHMGIRVVLAEGESVLIIPVDPLKPLPELEGSVPEGWKDAIYR